MRRLAKAPSAGVNRASAAGLAFFVVALLTLGLASMALAADQTYVKTYEGETDVSVFGSEGAGNGELTHPRRSAVEASTGNVLIADRDNHRVEVFAPTAHAAAYLTEFGAATLEEPFGIAVDQSNGDVYVSDPGKGRIFKFNSDGAATPTYTLDATFTSPASGSGAGQIGDFEADIAIDPTTGDLLVADPGNNRVDRYEADGTFVASFTGTGSPDGAFTGLLDLDVAPGGDIYVVDSTGPVFVEGEVEGGSGPCVKNNYCFGDPSRVLRFDASGVYQGTVQGFESNSAALVTVDPGNGQVLVGQTNPQGSKKVDVYSAAGARIDTIGFPHFFTWFPSMAAGGSPTRLYAVTDRELQNNFGAYVGEVAVQVFTPVALPGVAIDPVGSVTTSTAQLSGSVNPEGSAATWRFEYRAAGGSSWSNGPSGSAGEGTAPVPVSGELVDLEPNLSYEARLVAIGVGEKTIATSPVEFTTGGVAPIVHTWFTAPRTTDSARINGYVNPRNAVTTYRFEWGPTDSYGSTLPLGTEGSAGAGADQVLVSAQIAGLQPGNTYHYRVVAQSSFGSVTGEDRTFTTRTAEEMGPPQRGIELVTPPDKGNQNVSGYLANEGERVIWSTMTGSPGSSQGKGALFAAERSPTGWVSHSLLPPAAQMVGSGERAYLIQGATPDYSRVLFQIGEDANYGVPGDEFTFVRYAPGTGEQQELLNLPEGGPGIDYGDNQFYTSADATHVYTSLRDHPEAGSVSQLYDIGSGSKHLVSILPESGEPPACGVQFNRQEHLMSADGSRIYFSSRGDSCGEPRQLYLYDNHGTAGTGDDTVTRVSTPAVSGPEGEAIVARTSADARTVVYTSPARVTAEDSNSAIDLYRWSEGGGSQCLTCSVSDPGIELDAYGYPQNLKVSKDLSHVYISTQLHLVPGIGANGEPNLYVLANGQFRYVSPGVVGSGVTLLQHSTATPDGRTLVFLSAAEGITSDNNGGHVEAYRYSADDGGVECLSCNRGGVSTDSIAPPPNRPFMYFVNPPNGAEAQPLSNDGGTYVFKTEAALLPQDANGGPDIYEWHDGTLSLVTDGEGEYGGDAFVPLSLEGITADGTDILFRVAAHLTGFERDGVAQLFVARTGGGFAPPTRDATCNEDACQGPLDGAPSFTQPGSAGLIGPGDAREAAKPRKRAAKPCRRARHGKASAKSRASGARQSKARFCATAKKKQGKKGKRAHGKGSGK